MPRKPDPAKSCRTCGTALHRKRFNGRLEDLAVFTARKRCSEACVTRVRCHPERRHYGHGLCGPCYRETHRVRRAADGVRRRLRARGLSLEDYARMLKAQGGVCAICQRPERRRIRGKVTALTVDHDHATEEVRGLLCYGCNVSIGHLSDSPESLSRAIAYLKPRRQLQLVGA